MGEIVEAPQLRYTADNQTPISEFVVKFPGLREGDAAGQIKVIGWGTLAQEIQERYQVGERVLLEGRLGMNTVERPEGFKEKRAEMTVQRVTPIDQLQSISMAEPAPIAAGKFVGSNTPASTPAAVPAAPAAPATSAADYDDIPF